MATLEPGAKSPITTHVLNTARGVPGAGIPVRLEWKPEGVWVLLAEGITNQDGRITDLLSFDHHLLPGAYRLIFLTESYLSIGNDTSAFYSENYRCVFVLGTLPTANQYPTTISRSY